MADVPAERNVSISKKLRFADSLFEQLLPSDGLGVVPVLDFHPARALTLYVPAALPLGNNSLQIMLAGEAEQVFPATLDVIEIEQP